VKGGIQPLTLAFTGMTAVVHTYRHNTVTGPHFPGGLLSNSLVE
jgi:hypothetical protein